MATTPIIVNGFTVGTELQSCVLRATGGGSYPVNLLGHLKEQDMRQEVTKLTQTPVIYGGKRLHRNIYHDFSGRLTFGRYSGFLMQLIIDIVNNFQTAGYETYFTMLSTVFNSTINTTDEYLLTQMVIDLSAAGTYTGTSEVDQTLEFRAQALTITGSGTTALTP